MGKTVPDGEYDLDFSGLFSTIQSDVFGIRYGFKPDTIDESFPSFLYRDLTNINDNSNDKNSQKSQSPDIEIPCYLVCESKENSKAVTSAHNKDDNIYFEGRSKPTSTTNAYLSSTNRSHSSAMANSDSQSNESHSHLNSMSEFLLSYDDVSKSFKVDNFNGFIKMSKSREPEIIAEKIKKIETKKSSISINAENSKSYVDSLISSLSITNNKLINNTTIKRSISPVRSTSLTPIDSTITKSYGKSISGISPVRRCTSNSPMNSPTKNAFSSSSSLSPLPTTSTNLINKPSSPLKSTSTTLSIPSQSTSLPVTPTIKTNRITSNGGMGLKKTTKSSLMRKAERSVGISSSTANRISKPKPVSIVKETLNLQKNIDNKGANKNRESIGLKIKQREVKEARPEQTTFELNLTPPPIKSIPTKELKVVNTDIKVPVKSISGEKNHKSNGGNLKTIDSKKILKPKDAEIMNIKIVKKAQPEKIIEKTKKEKLTQIFEMNQKVEKEENIEKKQVENEKKIETKENHEKEEQIHLPNTGDGNDDDDDDFNIEFSDWEDADAIDGPVVSDERELTAGPNDFQVIIEDDPLKSKRENEKKKQYTTASDNNNKSNKLKNPINQSRNKNKEITNNKTEIHTIDKVKPNNKAVAKPKQSIKQQQPKVSPKAKKKANTIQKNKNAKKNIDGALHEDDEIDRELDAELNKAFDDLLDEEDMSEEE